MAIKKDRILIEKKNIPYRFTIALPRALYEVEIRYNITADIFTIALYRDNVLICIEPIIYGVQLFKQIYQPIIYPALQIIPTDGSGSTSKVTWDNFNETVFLEIKNTGDSA